MVVGLMVIVAVGAFFLGKTTKKLDESKWEEALDSLQEKLDNALYQVRLSEESIRLEYIVNDSLRAKNEELKMLVLKRARDHAEILDSLSSLSISELQEYFTKRYPPTVPGR